MADDRQNTPDGTAPAPPDAGSPDMEASFEEEMRLTAGLPLLEPEARHRAVRAVPVVDRLFRRIAAAERRYYDAADPSGLEEADWGFEDLAKRSEWADASPYRRSLVLRRVSAISLERYQHAGGVQELRRAGEFAREAVAEARGCHRLTGTPEESVDALRSLWQRYAGQSVDAQQEVTVPPREVAVQAAHSARAIVAAVLPAALVTLGLQLQVAFDADREPALIDEAVEVLTEAADDPLSESDTSAKLASALLLRFKAFGDPADAETMVDAARRALEHERSAPALDALGTCLIARAELPGHPEDSAEAVSLLEEAVRAAPASPWIRANLATALSAQYARHGRIQDAERSLALTESALAELPSSAPDVARLRQNALAQRSDLGRRHARAAGAGKGPGAATGSVTGTASGSVSRTPSEPGDAIEDARLLLAATPAGARARPARFGGLAHSLLEEFRETLSLTTLDEAIAVAGEGVAAVSDRSADRAHLHSAVAQGHALRYCLCGQERDLAEAESAARTAVDTAPTGEKAEWLLTLASVLSLRAARADSTAADLDAVRAAFRQSAEEAARLQQPSVKLRSCRAWGLWAAEAAAWQESADALGAAVDAADQMHRSQVTLKHRELSLLRAHQLHADAAVSLVHTGDAQGALLALERGRAQLLAETLAPGLDRDPALGVREIRAVARDRPLLYFAAGAHGAVAVSVSRTGEIAARPLEHVDADEVARRVSEFDSAQTVRAVAPDRWRAVLDGTMRWLGETLWEPALGLIPPDGALGVVPYGLLALLPLHAARLPDRERAGARSGQAQPRARSGRKRTAEPAGRAPSGTPAGTVDPQPHFVLDDHAVSVVPSARVLASCAALGARVRPESLLSVDVGVRPGARPLPHAGQEADAALAAYGRGMRLTADGATTAAVLAALPHHSVLHFACHGRADVHDPLSSALLLAGTDTLTVRELLGVRGLRARLAVLSACRTSLIGVRLPEESVGLPTALVRAGTAGVVGTLWEIYDVAGALLVHRFFDAWHRGEEPVEALRSAQRWLRDTTNGEKADVCPDLLAPGVPHDPGLLAGWRAARSHTGPEHWAAFTYTGW
ncbi:CHAT domain-containing protein [Streptomyces sp. NPDC054863]